MAGRALSLTSTTEKVRRKVVILDVLAGIRDAPVPEAGQSSPRLPGLARVRVVTVGRFCEKVAGERRATRYQRRTSGMAQQSSSRSLYAACS